jgi:hypothetical protein
MIILTETLPDRDRDGEVVAGIEWEKNKKQYRRWGSFRQAADDASTRYVELDSCTTLKEIRCEGQCSAAECSMFLSLSKNSMKIGMRSWEVQRSVLVLQ